MLIPLRSQPFLLRQIVRACPSMLWSRGPEVSIEDARLLLEAALPKLEERLEESVFECERNSDDNAPAIVSQTWVRREVEKVLRSSNNNLDTAEIATYIGAPRYAVDSVISVAAEEAGAYAESVLILPQTRIQGLTESLSQLEAPKSAALICEEARITIKALEYIVRLSEGRLLLADGFVVPVTVIETHTKALRAKLEAATSPVSYASIEPDATLLRLVKRALNVPNHAAQYMPAKFVDEKTAAARKSLEADGFIDSDMVESIEGAAKFAKRHDARVIGSTIVASSFLAKTQQRIGEALSATGYFDLRDLPLGRDFASIVLEPYAKYRTPKYAPYLVKPSLERNAASQASTNLAEAVRETVLGVDLTNVLGTTTIDELLRKVSLPTAADINEEIAVLGEHTLPEDLRMKVADSISSKVRTSYQEAAREILRPRLEGAVSKVEAKIRVYLDALLTLPEDLRASAWEEWQQYVSDHQFGVPDTEAVAVSQFSPGSTIVVEVAGDLLKKTEARLAGLAGRAKAGDAALVLHVASTVYHARHFANGSVLKIRGKLVPKLLRAFTFPTSFDELRKHVRDASPDLIRAVATDATA